MASYFIAVTGSDSNPGSQISPWRTFPKAASVMSPGDTLFVRNGSYPKISSFVSGSSWGSVITIKAFSGETVTIRKVGLQGAFQYIVFEDVFVDGENSGSGGNEAVYLASGANHIRFLRCDISRALTHGVLIPHPGTDYNEFVQSRLHHNVGIRSTGTRQYGIYASARYTLLDGCEIDNNGSYGVHYYNGYTGERADGQIVRNSRIHDNGRDDPASGGITMGCGDDSEAVNNLVWDNPRAGIDVAWRNPVNMKVYHNTLYRNGAGITIEASSSGASIKNNILWRSGSIVDNGSGTVKTPNFIGDPHFVNAP